ncbi:MAG: LysM peptidoglycan-binding domain-containing protein, partial [Gemmatimonadota bacterium]|nr:LysM peptidoglycan-binding domain-containing protein [Gemmatimonadota bacterium]
PLTTHTVKEGETLWGIAEHFGVAFTEVLALNGLSNAVIQPGQTLRIPVAAAAPTAGRSAPAPNRVERTEHVVRGGETLWSIAREHGTSVAELRIANSLDESAPIVPGQKLTIPRRQPADVGNAATR